MIFPEAAVLLGKDGRNNSSGGWLLAAAQAIVKEESIDLAVAAPTALVNELRCLKGENLTHYLFPIGKGNHKVNPEYEPYLFQIKNSFMPDIIHIHGTEYSHGLAYIKACGNKNVVVSIQGMISVIARYYNEGLTKADIIKNITIKDLVKGTLFQQKRAFERRGRYEIEMIRSVEHVIGRTTWDHAHALAINPKITYHFCNESLRDAFYSNKWEFNQCKPHSIFLSQVSYPIKGFHQLLKALPLVQREYPDVSVRIAGDDFIKRSSLFSLSGYAKYIVNMINKLGLSEKISFLGPLNPDQMKKEYLYANVFICPSSIENSSNSLGEAQLLGVPCISSYVGGAQDMIPNESCGALYRFDDVEVLAKIICDLFKESRTFNNSPMREMAAKRHDKSVNAKRLVYIYSSISNHL